MKKKTIVMTFVLCIVSSIYCGGLYAQNDGFFSEVGGSRASGIGASNNSTFSGYGAANDFRTDNEQGLSFESVNVNVTPYAPVGSGLFILTSIGIAYTYIKRRKNDDDNQ